MSDDAMRSTWTEVGAGWVEQERTFDAVFAPITEAVLAAATGRDARTWLVAASV